MAKTTVFIFGYIANAASVYDAGDYQNKVRLFFCDTPDDLPSDKAVCDLAIVSSNEKMYFVKAGVWTEIKGKKE